jgi:hypothetical protein
MSLILANEMWEALKTHMDLNEVKDAADTLVNLLIDNGYDAVDIRESFSDKHILNALKYYSDQADDFDEEDFEIDDDDY